MRRDSYAEYEQGWGDILAAAQQAVAAGESNLSRIMAHVYRASLVRPEKGNRGLVDLHVCGKLITGIDPLYQLPIFETIRQQILLSNLPEDCDAIIELGSGYGINLFSLWLNGAPRDATYWGCEYTSGGRAAAEFLAGYAPGMNFQSMAFDFWADAYPAIAGARNVFVFTSYSIEQVTEVQPWMLDNILAIPGLKRVVHIEPVGWQDRRSGAVLTKEDPYSAAARLSATSLNYNLNLISALESYAEAGKIILDRKASHLDFLAHRQTLPGSVIVWQPAAAA